MKTIKIIDLLNMTSKGEEVPKKIKFDNIYWNRICGEKYQYYIDDNDNDLFIYFFRRNLTFSLNDEVEIIEEKKKFIKEDFINERMGIDKITRKEFDEMYEVKECNCGMPYCKGFIAVDKEEPQEHKIPEKLESYISCGWAGTCKDLKREDLFNDLKKIGSKINEILDYLEKIE